MTVVVLDAGAMIELERRNTRMLALADGSIGARRIGYVRAHLGADAPLAEELIREDRERSG